MLSKQFALAELQKAANAAICIGAVTIDDFIDYSIDSLKKTKHFHEQNYFFPITVD